MQTGSGDMVSAQIGIMGEITGLQDADFSLKDGQPFNIKNDGIQLLELEVQLAGMKDGEFIKTNFECGWNPEIVKTVKKNSSLNLSLKWGY